MNIGFFAGSFDPFTIGHLQILKKASKFCDKVYVGIGINENKTRSFDKFKMQKAILCCIKREGLTNVDCIVYKGLTYETAKKLGCNLLIRGLRNLQDYLYEEKIAIYNQKNSDLETIYFRTDDERISSTFVRENMNDRESTRSFVPKEVFDLIMEKKR